MRSIVILLSVALLLAGCLGNEPARETGDARPPSGPAATVPSPGDPPATNESLQSPGAAETIVLYLTTEHALSLTLPAAGAYLDGNGLTNTGLIMDGLVLDPWPGPENASALQITAATVDVYYSSDTPQQTGGPQAGGDVATWIGEAGRSESFHQSDGPDQLAPGEVAHVTAEHELPAGGLVIPAGSSFALLLGIPYTQSPNAPVKVHVGGEEASRVTLTLRALPSPPLSQPVTREETGALDAQTPVVEIPITVNATTAMLEAIVEGVAPIGSVDVDILLLSPSGDRASTSSSPGASETVRAMWPNFDAAGPGEYVLRVQFAAQGPVGSATFTARITTWDVA